MPILDDTALKERFHQFLQLARDLLADFREVEHNFRQLDRNVRERIALWQGGKGALLEQIIGERDAIADSDQGRSFRAFWEFLMSSRRQNELTELLDRLLALPPILELRPDPRTRRVHYDWLEAGEHTQRTVAQLSQQLRRFLDDQAWLENRRIMEILHGIEARALALADRWDALLAIVQWRTEHPQAAVYLRQVDVPGVHSKLIEEHQAVLAELFTLALPLDPTAAAVPARDFSRRFGFAVKPTRIRFRVLDERIRLLPGAVRSPDVTLDSDSFAGLEVAWKRVFITENEINFLAFPRCEEAIVIFGGGYGWEALAQAKWLADTAVYYWGDIDTHGFAILDRLRLAFPHVQSMLMDHDTLYAHEPHWGSEPEPNRQDLPRLTASERALFDDLRDDRIRRSLRLEQERIAFGWLRPWSAWDDRR